MLPRRRCPFGHRWFHPHPRLKERQKTWGGPECRRQQKRESNEQWRAKNPDYFRDVYPQQKEKYGTRSEYRRHYREQHPDYVKRNAAFVRKRHQQLRQAPVSSTSSDLQVTIMSKRTSIRITDVSSTSRDIFVTLETAQGYGKVSR